MQICVISGKTTDKSAKKLALELDAIYCNPFKQDKRDFSEYNVVFNYGANRNIKAKTIINNASGVVRCIDKSQTLFHLSRCGIPTVEFANTPTDIPKDWQIIVVRSKKNSHGAKHLDYVEKGTPIPPDAELYTKYFDNKFELRVMVFKGKVVGRYIKEEDGKGGLDLNSVEPTGFEAIDSACIRAAEILGIDYVGFDVLANSETDFRILEANSGPTITDEAIAAIKESLNG